MTKFRFASTLSILALIGLVGCGVDGKPETPSAKPGVSVSGDARIGVSYSK